MSIITNWVTPPDNLSNNLTLGAVDVWRVLLDDSPDRASLFRTHLTDVERSKADRCHAPHPQYQFVITRGILRILLSRYLEVSPTNIHFALQPLGKPMLDTRLEKPIQFNVSHTRGMALIAIARQYPVGIDVERIDRKIQECDIAERYFSKRESAYLASLPLPERTNQFFSYWTCKEAYLKMQGKGISEGLAQCELAIDLEKPEVRLSHPDQQGLKENYSLYRIRAGDEHIGAVALAWPLAQISFLNWEDTYLT